MQNKFSIFIVVAFLGVMFFLINQPAKNLKPENIKYVKIAGHDIKIDLALTPIQQSRGLSGRQSLGEDEGMLFVFDHLGQYPFWMKEMNFPLDIIWLAPFKDGNGKYLKVVYLKKDARPETYPETYSPDANAKYVLEVISGFSDKNNLQIGDRVEFTY